MLDQFCRDNGFIGWMETSAKTGVNIDAAARKLVQSVLSHPDIFERAAAAKAARAGERISLQSTHGSASAAASPAAAAGGGSGGGCQC